MNRKLVVVLSFLLAGGALAQPKYTRKTKDIKVEQTERTKKLEKKEGGVGPAPEITADQFFSVELKVQGDVDELIKGIDEELKQIPPGDPLRFEFVFRQAEAYAQKQRLYHSQSMENRIKAERAKTPQEAQKFKAESDRNANLEKQALTNAIKRYDELIKMPDLDKFPQGEEAVFYYAFSLQSAGYREQAKSIFKILLQKFPGSKFVPEAYLVFGDDYFEQRDLFNAEAFYNKVMQFPKSDLYALAQYKRGWVYFNQKKFPDAMKDFKQVATLTNGQAKYEPLNRVAKKDFVRTYAEADSPVNVAYQVIQGLDKSEYSWKLYNTLGDLYLEQGKAAPAIYVFHDMMSKRPKDPLVCEWQYNVTRATMTVGNNQDKVRELSNLVRIYTATKKRTEVPRQTLDDCRENAAGTTGELAALWHVEGIKTLNMDTLGNAESLYHVYLDNFPDADNAMQTEVNYAELLWKRAEMDRDPRTAPKRWEAAAAEHSRVVQWKGVDEAQRKDSAYATVLAWKNALAVDPATDVRSDEGVYDKVPPPEPIPDKEQKMLDAFQVYLSYITDKRDQERVGILFFTGRMYWRHNHFDEAVKYLAEVVNEHPDSDVAGVAANVLLDSLNRAQRHRDMLGWVDRMRQNKVLMQRYPDLRANLDGLYAQGERNSAQSLEKTGQYRECGRSYERIHNANPNDPKVNEVLFNAAVCYTKAKMIGAAIKFREKLTGLPGAEKDPRAQEALLLLGDNYQAIAFYDRAAEKYELFANRFAGEKKAPDALRYATVYRRGLGQDDQAIKDIELYIKNFGKKDAKDAAEAAYFIASIYEKNKQTDKLVGHLEKWLTEWGRKAGIEYQIAANVRIGQALWQQSCPVKGENGSCVTITREAALKRAKFKRSATQTTCGPETKNKLTVVERKPAMVKKAQEHFNAALRLWANGEGAKKVSGRDDQDKTARMGETIKWIAAAQFNLAEDKYEDFLGLKFPEKLDFDEKRPAKKKDSVKRFAKWKQDKDALGAKVSGMYAKIVDLATSGGVNINAAPSAIAAAARMGQLTQNYSDALFTAEIPKDFRSDPEAVDAYCDELLKVADPLEKRSIEAFSFCLDNSNKMSWFSEWSQLCEAELAQIRPQDFPTAGEIHAPADNVGLGFDTQPIIPELEQPAPAAPPTAKKGTR